MKAITLTQPWATLVAIGAKAIETRGWQTSYRGPLAIHAAKGFPDWARALCHESPFGEVLRAAGVRELPSGDPDLPLGSIVAVSRLVDIAPTAAIRPMVELRDLVCAKGGTSTVCLHGVAPAAHELAFGDYSDGRYGWLLGDVHALREPIPCRGYQSTWDVPPALVAEIEAQLAGVAHV